MKKEFFMIVVIILLVISGDLITQKFTTKFFKEIENDLMNLRNGIITQNITQNIEKENLKQASSKIYNKWCDGYKILAYYIEHDELEKIKTQLTLINASIDVEDYNDTVMRIDEGIFLINHVIDKEDINLFNIF